jgi:hypothetical protein
MATTSGSTQKFKRAIDQQNKLERAKGRPAKQKRDAQEGKAAKEGLSALEKHSKGRPKQKTGQKATAKKSPQSARSQSR